VAQPDALRRGKLADKLGKLPGQTLGFGRQPLDALDKGFGLREVLLGLGQLLT